MSSFDWSDKDFKQLMTTVALVPVMAFAAGVFLGAQLLSQSDQPDKNTAISSTETVPSDTSEAYTTEPAVLETEAIVAVTAETEVVTEVPEASPLFVSEELPSDYCVQAGVFSEARNAVAYAYQLTNMIEQGAVEVEYDAEINKYRVVIKRFHHQDEAILFARKLKQQYDIPVYVTEQIAGNSARISML